MSAFIVATVRIANADRFADYSQAISGLSDKFGGIYLVRGGVTEFLEGSGEPGERMVVLAFSDAAAARSYIASPEYQAAKAKREGAATITMRLIET